MNIKGIYCEIGKKITSYEIQMNNKYIMLDYGQSLMNDEINRIDYIFITHEHLDHISGLIHDCVLLKKDCKIYSTRTTKKIILGYLKNSNDEKYEKKRKILEKINECQFDTEYENIDFKFKLFQAGHTFGSAMIYLYNEYSLLYTGDFNYYPSSNDTSIDLQYQINEDINPDYIIVDGTTLVGKNDFHQYKLSQILKDIDDFPKYYFNAKREKCVLAAKYLASKNTSKRIIYKEDLKWYLEILADEGYEPFFYEFNKKSMMLDYENEYDGVDAIYMSSSRFYEFSKDGKISLHIHKNDLFDFFAKYKNSKIIIGHYDLEYAKEIKKMGYLSIKEGDNQI